MQLLPSLEWPDEDELARIEALLAIRLTKPEGKEQRAQWYAALGQLRQAIFSLSPNKTLLNEAMRLWTPTDRYRATFSLGRDPSGEVGLVNALKAKDRDSLIKAFEAERDQI